MLEVPHLLIEKNLIDHVPVCASLLAGMETEPFLERVVTGDEKWALHNTVERKQQWSL